MSSHAVASVVVALPASVMPMRTETWDRAPLALSRTTTWDQPPCSIARTSTLLESSRVVYASPNLLAEQRSTSDPMQGKWPPQSAVPRPSAVPPTCLRYSFATPLQRLGTWSRAPAALVGDWERAKTVASEGNDSIMLMSHVACGSTSSSRPALQRAKTVAANDLSSFLCHVGIGGLGSLQRSITLDPSRVVTYTGQRADSSGLPLESQSLVASPVAVGLSSNFSRLRRAPTTQVIVSPVLASNGLAGSALPSFEEKPVLRQDAKDPIGRECPQIWSSLSVTPIGGVAQRLPRPEDSLMTSLTACLSVSNQTELVVSKLLRPVGCLPANDAKAQLPSCDPNRRAAEIGRSLLGVALSVVQPEGVRSTEPVGQLRLIVAGLMGSGKSTLCRALQDLLGGVWVNQDEFSHKGKTAKKSFLAEVKRLACDERIPALLVDKINTMEQHRREILEAMEGGTPGCVVLLQMRHPADEPGHWKNAIQLCLSRIHSRGEGHRTLKGDNPELQKILYRTANDVQPLTENEKRSFRACVSLDMTLSPVDLIKAALESLAGVGLLEGLDLKDLTSDERISEAMMASKAVELNLAGAKEATDKKLQSSKPKSKSEPPTKSSSVWLYELKLDDASVKLIDEFWSPRLAAAPHLKPVPDYHVTLLYLGGGSDEEIASRSPFLGGPEAVARLRDYLVKSEGVSITFEALMLVEDCRIACLQVSSLGAMCANHHAHITLACADRVPPRISNELLARKAAAEDIQAGLGPWLAQVGLTSYELLLLKWCADMGAANLDEIAENAADAAAAAESDTKKQLVLKEVLSKSAPPGFRCEALVPPLCLSGHIWARKRGQ